MVLRIGQVHHPAARGAQPDDSLAHAQARVADRPGIQALGGGKLENIARTAHVSRADLGHQLGRH